MKSGSTYISRSSFSSSLSSQCKTLLSVNRVVTQTLGRGIRGYCVRGIGWRWGRGVEKKKEQAVVLGVFCLLLSISKTLPVLSQRKKTSHFSQENPNLLQRQAAAYSYFSLNQVVFSKGICSSPCLLLETPSFQPPLATQPPWILLGRSTPVRVFPIPQTSEGYKIIKATKRLLWLPQKKHIYSN